MTPELAEIIKAATKSDHLPASIEEAVDMRADVAEDLPTRELRALELQERR